jgi:hypothetical protein
MFPPPTNRTRMGTITMSGTMAVNPAAAKTTQRR